MGQQELLLWIVGKIARRHLPTTFTTGNRMTARLLPRRLLAAHLRYLLSIVLAQIEVSNGFNLGVKDRSHGPQLI
jgi:hypothetical protein